MSSHGNLGLLHGSGLDELVMIVVGLVAAYAVIALTGRKGNEDAPEVSTDEPSD